MNSSIPTILFSVLLALPAAASQLTFVFNGTVTEVDPRITLLDNSVVQGSPFTGSVVISTLTVADQVSTDRKIYRDAGEFSFDLGAFSISSPIALIDMQNDAIRNNLLVDRVRATGGEDVKQIGGEFFDVIVSAIFTDDTARLLESPDITELTSIDLGAATSQQIRFQSVESGKCIDGLCQMFLHGEIESVTLLPEPSARLMTLVLIGFLRLFIPVKKSMSQ